ncbi:MAG TPA: nuclear transport factor 2 family protein [Devosiaceae bacterium]|jgi:uncharacterized protein (TIGR02246 family)|nr:nuclear transport factor 2 family protein [Devosiaceae bacterium]
MQRLKPIHAVILPILLAVPGVALGQQQDVEAIEDRLGQYEARFNAGDAEAVAELFSDDVTYYDALGQVHEGRDAVEQLCRGNFEAGFTDMTIDTVEIEVFGDTAYDIARYTVSGPGGNQLEGHHLAILAKEGDEWMVQRTLVNALPPEPPAQ